MEKISIDYKSCDKLVDFLKKHPVPEDNEEPIKISLPDDVTKNLYFALVAICHQTTPMNGPALQGTVDGTFWRGWDYLRAVLLKATAKDNSIVYPTALSKMISTTLFDLIKGDDGKGKISNLNERVRLLNDMGSKMLQNGVSSVQQLFEQSGGYLDQHGEKKGLYQLLSEFEAYSDPVKKKSSYFFTLMKRQGFWNYADQENLLPVVDYHEIRINMRLGTVKINDEELRSKLATKQEVTWQDDIDIRSGVQQAMVYIANEAGIGHGKLHYFLWNLSRNCCNRDAPHCSSHGGKCALPQRYVQIGQEIGSTSCLFSPFCESAGKEGKLFDHVVKTHYY